MTMAFSLDSDTFRFILRGDEAVLRRISQIPVEEIWLSSVALAEAMQGRLATINAEQSKLRGDVPGVYAKLIRTVEATKMYPFLPYTAAAETLFQSWPASVKRVGTNDCRIAASAITSGLTIVTRNARDYERIPGAVFVDWASEP